MADITHRLVANPQISARHLADYMDASDRVRRSILKKCKYQPVAPVVQHNDAKQIIANHLRTRKGDINDLNEKVERLSRKICDSDFEERQLRHNIDYVRRFGATVEQLELPKAELLPARKLRPIILNGTKVNFSPNLLFSRRTKTNALKIGAISFRYSKGADLDEGIAAFQAAFTYGYLREFPFDVEAEPELKLCLVLDNQSGNCFAAPGDSIARYNNMAAACHTIADCWAAIEPPPRAVIR
jgi:hypothetical protein